MHNRYSVANKPGEKYPLTEALSVEWEEKVITSHQVSVKRTRPFFFLGQLERPVTPWILVVKIIEDITNN